MEDILNSAYDIPDERDFIYENQERAGSEVIKDFCINNDGEYQNQHKEGFENGCVYFSSSMHDNYLNFRDNIQDRTKGGELCNESTTRDKDNGDLIINGPKLLLSKELIEGFFKITTLNGMYEILSKGYCIHTGSNKINRAKTSADLKHIANMSGGGGHCFHLIGYNKTDIEQTINGITIPAKVFIAKNSSSMKIFFIRITEYENLFSKYYFENKVEVILSYKQKIMEGINIPISKIGFELGLYNGLDNTKPITREESVAIMMRMLQKMYSGEITKEKFNELLNKYKID